MSPKRDIYKTSFKGLKTSIEKMMVTGNEISNEHDRLKDPIMELSE